jgi:SAM-dependent methyltransferase
MTALLSASEQRHPMRSRSNTMDRLRDVPIGNIYGADVATEALRLCLDAGVPTGLIKLPTALSPIQLPDRSIDFVISNSVFSHLSEYSARHYIQEFHRILKPGGVAAMTTRAVEMFDYVVRLREKQRTETIREPEKVLVKCYTSPEADKAAYMRGEFIFRRLGKDEHYGEAAIPPQWVNDFPRRLYSAVDFLPASAAGLEQSVIYCRK